MVAVEDYVIGKLLDAEKTKHKHIAALLNSGRTSKKPSKSYKIQKANKQKKSWYFSNSIFYDFAG